MKKAIVLVVGFVFTMVGLTLLLNVLHSPVWFCALVAISESVLFTIVMVRHEKG
jgi:hypothetical protein